MSRTRAEKRALARTPYVRPPIPATPDVTPEQGKQAVRLLVTLVEGGEASCSFAMSRHFAGGTCAEENGRGFPCFTCAAIDWLRSVGALAPKL